MKKYIFLFSVLLLPFLASAQSLSDYEIGNLEFTPLGSNATLRMGEFGEIGKFRITNRGDRTLAVEQIRLRNYGTAHLDQSFQNIELYGGLEKISENVQVIRDYVTFYVSNTLVGRGDSLIFTARGQLIYAKSNRRTVQLGIRREEDILLKEVNSGFFANCESCEKKKLKTYTLRLGGLSINRNSSYSPRYRYYGSRQSTYNPYYGRTRNQRTSKSVYHPQPKSYARISTRFGNQSYSAGAKDVIFFSNTFNSKIAIQVEGLFLELASGTASDKNGNNISNEVVDFSESFSDFTLYIDGEYIDSIDDFEEYNNHLGLLFNRTFTIEPNSQLILSGRVKNKANNGDKVQFRLNSDGLIDPTYQYNYKSISSRNIYGGTSGKSSNIGGGLRINKR